MFVKKILQNQKRMQYTIDNYVKENESKNTENENKELEERIFVK